MSKRRRSSSSSSSSHQPSQALFGNPGPFFVPVSFPPTTPYGHRTELALVLSSLKALEAKINHIAAQTAQERVHATKSLADQSALFDELTQAVRDLGKKQSESKEDASDQRSKRSKHIFPPIPDAEAEASIGRYRQLAAQSNVTINMLEQENRRLRDQLKDFKQYVQEVGVLWGMQNIHMLQPDSSKACACESCQTSVRVQVTIPRGFVPDAAVSFPGSSSSSSANNSPVSRSAALNPAHLLATTAQHSAIDLTQESSTSAPVPAYLGWPK